LKKIVYEKHGTSAAKVAGDLSNHLEDRSNKNSLMRASQINICDRAAVARLPITESKAKRRKRWCDDHKTCRLMIGNT
jgi:hypothetical protein